MKVSKTFFVLVLISCLGLGTGVVGAQQGSGGNGSDNGEHEGTVLRTVTAATLAPTGDINRNAWGRVMVMDSVWEDDEENLDVRRTGMIHLIGLTPETEYTVAISASKAVETNFFAAVLTNALGDGWLRMGVSSRDSGTADLASLPPAEELEMAMVTDPNGDQVLSGEFIVVSQGGLGQGGMLYMERISLTPTDDTTLRGTARVARDGNDDQHFATRACGLIPNEFYTVLVDGIEFAVQADAIGHAALVMSTDEKDDPLPAELQEIEGIVSVEWFKDSERAHNILSGSFAGENMVGSKGPVGGSGHGSGSNGGGNGHGGNGHGGNGGGQGGGNGGGHK